MLEIIALSSNGRTSGFEPECSGSNPLGASKIMEGWQSWSIAPVLKTGDLKGSVGSNPTPSAKL